MDKNQLTRLVNAWKTIIDNEYNQLDLINHVDTLSGIIDSLAVAGMAYDEDAMIVVDLPENLKIHEEWCAFSVFESYADEALDDCREQKCWCNGFLIGLHAMGFDVNNPIIRGRHYRVRNWLMGWRANV